jgi:hypothetical protein
MAADGALSQLSTGLLLPDVVHRICEEGQVRARAACAARARPSTPPACSRPRAVFGVLCVRAAHGRQRAHAGDALPLRSVQALRWDPATGCYEVIDGALFERRFDELRRKRDRDDGSNGRPFSRMHKYYKLQAGERWAKQVGHPGPALSRLARGCMGCRESRALTRMSVLEVRWCALRYEVPGLGPRAAA